MDRTRFSSSAVTGFLFAALLCPTIDGQIPPDTSPGAVAAQSAKEAAQSAEEPSASPELVTRGAPVGPANIQGARSHLEELGDLYVLRKRYLDAVNAYEQAAGDSAVIWNKMGVAYQHMFNVKAARASYQRALQLNPKDAEAMNNLGTIYFTDKDYHGAEKCYQRALKLSPHSAIVYANLGTARFARGDYKRGAKSYREAFHLDPAVFDPESTNKIQEEGSREARAMLNFNLAKFYAGAGRNKQALVCLRQALDDGFRDRKRLMEDEELADLRATQEFRLLLVQQGLH